MKGEEVIKDNGQPEWGLEIMYLKLLFKNIKASDIWINVRYRRLQQRRESIYLLPLAFMVEDWAGSMLGAGAWLLCHL